MLDSKLSVTREKILDSAAQCLVHFGISKTTMNDVARRAGVSRASVYRYFADRENLIEAAIRRRALSFIGENVERLKRWPSFRERLEEGIAEDVARGVEDPLMRLVSAMPTDASTSIGRPRLYGELTYQLWEPVLVEARDTGDLRADLELEDIADWIARLEIMFMSQFEAGAQAEREVRRYVRTFVLPALVIPGGTGSEPVR